VAEHPTDLLSDLEKEVLRAFLQSSDQKELARRIGRSPSTVEQRLARARRKLGVPRSLDAALLLAKHEGHPTYGNGIYADSTRSPRAQDALNIQSPRGDGPHNEFVFFPSRGRPWNMLPLWARFAVIVGGLAALLVATVSTVNIMESVARIVRQQK
jgi:DNA-binding CsgD family transcriptional regulator